MLYRTAGSKRREREKLKKSTAFLQEHETTWHSEKNHTFFSPQIWGFYGLFPPSFWSIWATPTWDSSQSLAPGVDVGRITRLARSQWPSILVQYVFIYIVRVHSSCGKVIQTCSTSCKLTSAQMEFHLLHICFSLHSDPSQLDLIAFCHPLVRNLKQGAVAWRKDNNTAAKPCYV